MSNYEFVIGLRAIRHYRDEPLKEVHLTAILEAARWTGSSKNLQKWSFVVVQERQRLGRLAACGDFTSPLRDSAATVAVVEEPGGYEFDSGRAAQNIMLAACAVGVVSCPITLHRDEDAARVLELPEGRRCRYAIALGYPTDDAAPARFGGRKPFDELVHWERY